MKKRIRLSQQDLKENLQKQLEILRQSCEKFDNGNLRVRENLKRCK